MKALKKMLLTSLLIVLIVIGSAIFVWFFPEILINVRTAKWVYSHQNVVTFQPSFPENILFEIKNEKIWKQSVRVEAAGFCFEMKEQGVKGCVKELTLRTLLNFSGFKLKVESLGPVKAEIPSFEVATQGPSQKKQDAEKDSSSFLDGLPALSKNLHLAELDVRAPSILIRSKNTMQKAQLKVHGSKRAEDDFYLIDLNAQADSNKDPKKIVIAVTARIDPTLNATGRFNVNVGTAGKKPSAAVDGELKWNIPSSTGDVVGNARIVHLDPVLPLLEIKGFKIKSDDKLALECNFTLELSLALLNKTRKSALPPAKFATKFSGSIQAKKAVDEPVEFSIAVKPVDQYGINLSAETNGKFVVEKSDLQLSKVIAVLYIPSFQNTVNALKKTQLAIPAPFNDLDGTMRLEFGEDKLVNKKNEFNFPVHLTTNLKSKDQSLITVTDGALALNTKSGQTKLKLQTTLNDIVLQAPNFEPIEPIPTLKADPRVIEKVSAVEKKQSPDEGSKFELEIQIKTEQRPVVIKYKLFEPAAAFRVKALLVSSGPGVFELKFEPMKIAYLKREARLEKLIVGNTETNENVQFNGRISMKRAGYTIFADLLQVENKPRILLSAEPPLSNDDIVSLLLFNQLSSELDSGSTKSVQDTQSALTKRSIGFFSFWILASTPVESVSYDPATQLYSARVKLPGNLIGTVGSDWDKAQEVGLRKRLGGRWVISAGVGTDSEGESRQESMIEWFNRY